MPIGTGNDLSRHLNCGSKLNSIKLDTYIRNIIKKDLRVEPIDIWTVNVKNKLPCINDPKLKKKVENYKTKNFTKLMILYMGIGYDAHVVYLFEKIRKYYPLLMVSTKISRLYFAFIYFYLLFKSIYQNYLNKIYSVINMKDMETSENLPSINNLIFMNCKYRSGGMFNEWNKSKRCAVKHEGKSLLLNRDRLKKWKIERVLYSKEGIINNNIKEVMQVQIL